MMTLNHTLKINVWIIICPNNLKLINTELKLINIKKIYLVNVEITLYSNRNISNALRTHLSIFLNTKLNKKIHN